MSQTSASWVMHCAMDTVSKLDSVALQSVHLRLFIPMIHWRRKESCSESKREKIKKQNKTPLPDHVIKVCIL